MTKYITMTLVVVGFVVGTFVPIAEAGPDMAPPFVFTSVVSTTTNTVTSPVYQNAWVDAIVLDWTDGGGVDGTQTGTVTIATVGGTGSGPARTILTLTGTATDSVVYPRAVASGTTGSALSTPKGERIPLVQDKIIVSAYCVSTNTTTLTVRIITSPTP
jgi:hypothetical protein